jgi:hypothetical protein
LGRTEVAHLGHQPAARRHITRHETQAGIGENGRDVTVDDRDPRILCKNGSDFLHPVVVDFAVIIGHSHDVGPCLRQPDIVRDAEADRIAANVPETRIFLELLNRSRSVVIRALIDHDELEARHARFLLSTGPSEL